ncbi:MAG: hypothetical protein AABX80_01280 [Nanoarchaeota archaeon]
MTRANMHLISSYKNSFFESDLYFAKKIKEINSEGLLDAIFADSFENFPILPRYCSRYKIELKKMISSDTQKNYDEILDYARENLDKDNLAYLLKNEEVEKVHNLFKNNIFFNTFVL